MIVTAPEPSDTAAALRRNMAAPRIPGPTSDCAIPDTPVLLGPATSSMQYLCTMDEMLIAAFREGDPQAIRVVYREFARPVASVARTIVGNHHLVDDIVQQTFTKAWKAAQTFDPSRRFAPWLFSIARRTAIDAIRSEQRPHVGAHEPEKDVVVGPPSLEKAWEAFEVRRAIGMLPDEERETVELSYRLGLTQTEIATHLDVPVGTVKSRSHRAHRRLSVILAHLKETDAPPPLEANERRNIG